MPKAERKAKAEIEYRHEYGEGEFLPNGLFIRLYYQIAAGGNMGIGVNGAAAVFIIVTIAEEETVVLIKVQRLAVYGDLHALVGLRLGYGFIGLEQLVKAYAVYAAEHYKVICVGRGLRALPFAHGLARKAKLCRKLLLRIAVLLPELHQPVCYFDIHRNILLNFSVA